ncbi:thioesterase family protein [Phanerochaete sordida]|uniref:Thioesterase family protein n=1 Tax=Phanerochaete sordida TaxID=48140 RepID=A0A9P3LB34_9APHY|nr:thioesterase family protein [Phanerochaete sordida]
MAPLSQAVNAEFAYREDGKDGRAVYRGTHDEEWTVLSVPNGGYVLAQVIEAAVKHQASTQHPDPIHVTAHFMRASVVGPFEVYIRDVKTGRDLKHLSATIVQNDEEKVLVQLIFGQLVPTADPGYREPLTLAPPSPYASYTPMHTHPAQCAPDKAWKLPRYNYRDHIRGGVDPVHAARYKAAPRGLVWGDYITLTDAGERLRPSLLAFFADCFRSYTVMIPTYSAQNSWLPTIVMTLEFKFPIPPPTDPNTSPRTVAVFTQSKFINEPNARNDSVIELWTAPADVGDGPLPADDSWKEHQRCLAVSTQMALVTPAAVNRKQGARGRL